MFICDLKFIILNKKNIFYFKVIFRSKMKNVNIECNVKSGTSVGKSSFKSYVSKVVTWISLLVLSVGAVEYRQFLLIS